MTPQDREEHRLAALAAGYEVAFRDGRCMVVIVEKYNYLSRSEWQPKINKADCFDLMVACGMSIDFCEGLVRSDDMQITVGFEPYDSEAAMQAAFNCAVEIGRDKEGKELK